MKIVFTGDVFTGGDLLFKNHSVITHEQFVRSDLRVCNLEQGTGDNTLEIKKSTVHAPLKSLEYLSINKIDIVSLANNHIQDKGVDGFTSTLEFLRERNIRFVGAGENAKEASMGVKLTDQLFLYSFCSFGKSYLRKVQIAESNQFGVNRLTYEHIIECLRTLPQKAKAILYLHWGRENVWLPPSEDVKLAKKLLELDQVHSIIGMHSHRAQGIIKHNGKTAFMSLGNFMFPNFYIKPRTQMYYPEKIPIKSLQTKEYHPVFSITYKIWKRTNRISLVPILDTEIGLYNINVVIQDKLLPLVNEVSMFRSYMVFIRIKLLSQLMKVPSFVYKPLELAWRMYLTFIRYFNVLSFYVLKEKKLISIFKMIKQQ